MVTSVTRRVLVYMMFVFLLASVVIWTGGCSSQGDNEIVLGAIMPLTGDLAVYGEPVKAGMDYAVTEINADGGVNGRMIRIVFEDDLGSPTTAVSAFNKLVDVEKVPAILGPLTSGASMATAPVAERRKVLQLSTIAGTMKLKTAGDYVFRVFASDELQGLAIADKAIDVFEAQKAAILYINNEYGQGILEVVSERFQERGGEVVVTEGVNEGDTDFRTQLVKITQTDVDLIFALCYHKEGSLILVQAKELGINKTFLGGDAWFGPVWDVAKDASENLVFTNMAFGEAYEHQPKMQEFISSYKGKTGKEPDAYAATGYDAVNLIANAMRTGGDTSDGIKQALYATQNYTGALGKISYDEYGDNLGAEFDLYTWRGGETVRYIAVE